MNAIRRRFRWRGRLADTGVAVLAITLAVVLAVGTLGMNVRGNQVPGPQFFPLLVAALLFVSGVVLLVAQLRMRDHDTSAWHRPDVSRELLGDLGANTELLRVAEERAGASQAGLLDAGAPNAEAQAPEAEADADTAHPIDWRTVGIVVGAIALFIVTLEFAGWILAGTALFWLVAFAFGNRRHLFGAGVALLAASLVQLLFVAGLGLALPSGFVGVFS